MKNKKGSRRNRNRGTGEVLVVDRFTKLPDDLLLNILDRLNTPDAVRTCLLSKRTIHLRHLLPNLQIWINSFVPDCGYATLKDTIPMNAAVADATENLLSFRRQDIALRQLSIGFYLRYYDCLTIGKAVARAMAIHNLHSAEFIILTQKPPLYSTSDECRRNGKELMTFFGACTDAFAGLTRLHLSNLKLGEADIPNILATCKQLEYLQLAVCQTDDSVLQLQLEHPRLVELDISTANIELVELNSLPNLKRLVFSVWVCPQEPLSFGNVPLLSSLSLTNVAMRWQKVIRLSQFLANITFIKDLHLNFLSEKIWVHPECPELLAPVLQNLQVLNLDELPGECDIAWTRFFLEAAPSLKEMCITVRDHWCDIETDKVEREEQGYCDKTNVEWESSAPDGFRHYNLVKLTIYGFQPNENFTGYIRHIMEAAVNLEDISLYDRKVEDCCEELDPKIKVAPSRYPQTIEEQELLRKQITEGLVMASPHLTGEANVLLKYHQGIGVQSLIGGTRYFMRIHALVQAMEFGFWHSFANKGGIFLFLPPCLIKRSSTQWLQGDLAGNGDQTPQLRTTMAEEIRNREVLGTERIRGGVTSRGVNLCLPIQGYAFDECGISPLTVKTLTDAGSTLTTYHLVIPFDICDLSERVITETFINQEVTPHSSLYTTTRELAIQLSAEASVLLKYHAVQSLIGGTRFKRDQRRLESNTCQLRWNSSISLCHMSCIFIWFIAFSKNILIRKLTIRIAKGNNTPDSDLIYQRPDSDISSMKNKKGSRRNRNKSAAAREVDRLTKLPDEVLLNILDRLNTPDAIRTCLLSKRTLHLRHLLSHFVISAGSFFPRSRFVSWPRIIQANIAVADATDNVLNFRSQHIPLRRLSICFYLRYYDCLTIGKAVAQAMATHNLIDSVEFIILTELLPECYTVDDLRRNGKQFMNFLGAYPDAFAGLTRLFIQNLRLAEADIPTILTTCRRLQYLRLSVCDTEDSVLQLQLEHPRLVELDIYNAGLHLVELSSLPNLKRLISPGEPLSFGNVPMLSSLSLSNVSVGYQEVIRLSHFLANVPSISDLHLNFASEKIWVQPECPKLLAPVLQNLQVLNLDKLPEGCDIAWTRFFLEAAPNLKEMSITVWDHWCDIEKDSVQREELGYCDKTNVEWLSSQPDGFKHHNLVKLTIYGFQPDDNFIGYIRCMMETAVNLEKISLYGRKFSRCCCDLDPKIKVAPSRYPRTIKQQKLVRRKITEGFGIASSDIIRFRS
uniref:F-box domain-containing protein n=1 Tax=Oryza punctata TaxID=4537 RepID=A0A0E0K748_ORYPU